MVVESGFKKGSARLGKRDSSHFSSVTLQKQSVKRLRACTTYMSLGEEVEWPAL